MALIDTGRVVMVDTERHQPGTNHESSIVCGNGHMRVVCERFLLGERPAVTNTISRLGAGAGGKLLLPRMS
jgi:hypothetical protein